MRDNGALTVFDLWEDALNFSHTNVIVFFSHQWLGWSEPDPKNVHYPVMIEALTKLQEKFQYNPAQIYVWIDYSSIPQKNESSQLSAIDSIGNYAALSKHFIVVAPETIHCNTGDLCDSQTYRGRGWCRLEQWAGMAANPSTDHMWVIEKHDLKRLSSHPEWITESVNVFMGNFTCASDKEKLVDVVMALYAFTIACGQNDQSGAANTTSNEALCDEPSTSTSEMANQERSALLDLIHQNRQHIFPPEWFGDTIDVLEAAIETALDGKANTIFSSDAFDRLLRARQELCRLHGAELPKSTLVKFSSRIEAVRKAAVFNERPSFPDMAESSVSDV